MKRRPMTLEQSLAERLGIEFTDGLGDELAARFEHLTRFLLAEEMPPAGKAVSAEAATAHGELWVLTGFLADARQLMAGEGVEW